mgnify:FL=1
MSSPSMQLFTLPDMPLVKPGDDLATLITDGLSRAGEKLQDGDILVLAQKIVSKAANRIVDLRDVMPTAEAEALAVEVDKDPRQVQLILDESVDVVGKRPGVLIVAHRIGIVMANAGIDASNVEQDDGTEHVLLLPEDPDADSRALRQTMLERHGVEISVIINDSVGRAWRQGTMGLAIGSAGLPALWDLRGDPDLFGRELLVSEVGLADELSPAASILQGQGNEGRPVVVIRGVRFPASDLGADALVRPKEMDMFR